MKEYSKPSFFKKHRKSVFFSIFLGLLGIFTSIIFPPAKLIAWGLFIQKAISITPLVTQGAIGAGVGLTSGIALSWLGNREAIRTLWQNHWKLITFTSALMLTAILVSLLCPPAFLVSFLGTLKGIGLSTLYAKVVICNVAAVVAGITGGFLSWVANKLSQLNATLILFNFFKSTPSYLNYLLKNQQPTQSGVNNRSIVLPTNLSNESLSTREKLAEAIARESQCDPQHAAELLNEVGKAIAPYVVAENTGIASPLREVVRSLILNHAITAPNTSPHKTEKIITQTKDIISAKAECAKSITNSYSSISTKLENSTPGPQHKSSSTTDKKILNKNTNPRKPKATSQGQSTHATKTVPNTTLGADEPQKKRRRRNMR